MAPDVQPPADLDELTQALNELTVSLESLKSLIETAQLQSLAGNLKMALTTVRFLNRRTGELMAKHWPLAAIIVEDLLL